MFALWSRSGPHPACVLAAMTLAASCVAEPSTCGGVGNARPAAVVQLAFGLNVGDRRGVSEAAFQRFLDEQVTPRFPDGLTVIDGEGRWRAQDGVQVAEASKVVTLVTADGPVERARIEAIRQAYIRMFRQDSVLLLTQRGCASF